MLSRPRFFLFLSLSFYPLSLTRSSLSPRIYNKTNEKTTKTKQSDTLHIVHVAKVMSPREEVSHGPPGTSLSYRDESLDDVRRHVDEARAWLRDVVVPAATEAAVAAAAASSSSSSAPDSAVSSPPSIRVHLFVDKTTASADDVAATLSKAADDLGASLLVLSKSNKTGLDRLFVGSVASKTQKACGRPVLLVSAARLASTSS